MLSLKIEKMVKRRREILAVYMATDKGLWRRIYPETFYPADGLINIRDLEYVDLIYQILLTVIDGHRQTLIEDELNLMYMDMENKAIPGNFSEGALSAIQGRLDLKKQTIEEIRRLSAKVESSLADLVQKPPNIRLRLESTVYLVRLLAYGLFSDNDIVLDRVAEVFDVARLQAATRPKDKHNLDETLKFLYKGLIQKNERGRQGSRHAARQTLAMLREWYPDNEYVIMCIDKIGKYI